MSIPVAPSQPCTYAIGDVHGEVTLLRRLLLALPLRDNDCLVFIGDYLDFGEDSAATLTLLQELATTQRCVFLRGNHEDAWLEQFDGVSFSGPGAISGSRKAWQDFRGSPSPEVGHWLARTRIDYEDEHAYYVHAGVLPHHTFAQTPPLQKLWGAGSFLESSYHWGKPVVFGHWPLRRPLLQPNKIGINTHAYQSGVLTAVRLPDRVVIQAAR
jgi:serine/threonine protein phosphatase 1